MTAGAVLRHSFETRALGLMVTINAWIMPGIHPSEVRRQLAPVSTPSPVAKATPAGGKITSQQTAAEKGRKGGLPVGR